jgi:hypothetical protein
LENMARESGRGEEATVNRIYFVYPIL